LLEQLIQYLDFDFFDLMNW